MDIQQAHNGSDNIVVPEARYRGATQDDVIGTIVKWINSYKYFGYNPIKEVAVRTVSDHGETKEWTYRQLGTAPLPFAPYIQKLIDGTDTAEVAALKAEIEQLKQANATIAAQTRNTCEQEFVEKVMEYHEGCAEGKASFVEWCGYEVPTREIRVTLYCEVPVTTDVYSVENDVRYAVEIRGEYTYGCIDAEEY